VAGKILCQGEVLADFVNKVLHKYYFFSLYGIFDKKSRLSFQNIKVNRRENPTYLLIFAAKSVIIREDSHKEGEKV